ncbi:tetratricopeptide repeat protein [Bacillus weihaiensis]|uniref:Uncharacterized protein n=1 Tax=Bacillus weihaiensis TaxID=1547283 RepID=A0A1L3MR33_9BACI|nr:hypothetical protein [Bacillus weihaiensis]APH04762.1 hypothetical protein A9C19_08390 [Bacillus weihaiensis]
MVQKKGDWKKEFEEAEKLHNKAIKGDKEAAKKAYTILKQIKQVSLNDSKVEALYGSSSALVARDQMDLIEKTNLAKRGLKSLDKAVATEPKNIDFRILRGNVAFRLPEMYFKRTKTAIEDFEFLIKEYESKKTNLNSEQYYEFLLNLGTSYNTLGKSNEAEKVWNKLVKMNPSFKPIIENVKRNGGE